jgi:hypothetical protein
MTLYVGKCLIIFYRYTSISDFENRYVEKYSLESNSDNFAARKIGGRCFAINYRKAPQYPFPCAVQDVLAGCKFFFSYSISS